MRESHKCAARGCCRMVPWNMLMCKPHWRMVPKAIQSDVWAGYKSGDREFHFSAIKRAQEAVAEEDRHDR
jgi:hypothetical protein